MEAKRQADMTLKEWIITFVLLALPIANIVFLIIWASDKQEPRNLFAKAYLIVMGGMLAIVFSIYFIMILFFVFIGALVGAS